jgi:hypothetical protein
MLVFNLSLNIKCQSVSARISIFKKWKFPDIKKFADNLLLVKFISVMDHSTLQSLQPYQPKFL